MLRIVSNGVVSVGMAGCIGVTTIFGESEDHAHDEQAAPERRQIFDRCMSAVTANQSRGAPQASSLITN
jgi:hypothetical protein